MNYFAVTALMARIYYYMGNNELALQYAKEVIAAADEGRFTFTKESDFTVELSKRDVVMQNELIFALEGLDVKSNFYGYDASSQNSLILLNPNELYPDADDFRKNLIGESTNNNKTISYKYAKTSSSTSNSGIIPMIRLTEMYFIAADCSYESNKDEAVEYLKKYVR